MVSLCASARRFTLLDHDTNGFAVPIPPKWVREVTVDILDVIGFSLIHGLPLIVSVGYLVCHTVEPNYVFV